MMQKLQKFGGAMLAPVLLFTYSSMIIGIAALCKNTTVLGDMAAKGTLWYNIWNLLDTGARTVINQTPLLFAIGLPIGLAKKENAKCCMITLLLYLTFNYYLNAILTTWGASFGIDIASTAKNSGLTTIAGIRTLDTGMIGALVVAGISVYLHNRFYDTELPEMVGVFQGACFVGIIGLFVMLGVAFGFVIVWPQFQKMINSLQVVLTTSGAAGVGLFGVLLKLLLPFGLHHFLYTPIEYDSVLIAGGTVAHWASNLENFAMSTEPLIALFPEGGFGLKGCVKVFGSIGAALALYSTAKPQKKKAAMALLIPAAFTAVVAGITEPLEYTFLFVAPGLFLVHALLSGAIMVVEYMAGIVGNFGNGLLGWMTLNFIPLWQNHWKEYLIFIAIGIVFIGIWFVVFRFLILKFDLKTPGREADDEETKLISKKEYKEAKGSDKKQKRRQMAIRFVEGLGGKENILSVTNCMTRLRVSVKDETKVKDNAWFVAEGAKGLVKAKGSIQVIVGVDVAYVKAEVEEVLK